MFPGWEIAGVGGCFYFVTQQLDHISLLCECLCVGVCVCGVADGWASMAIHLFLIFLGGFHNAKIAPQKCDIGGHSNTLQI